MRYLVPYFIIIIIITIYLIQIARNTKRSIILYEYLIHIWKVQALEKMKRYSEKSIGRL